MKLEQIRTCVLLCSLLANLYQDAFLKNTIIISEQAQLYFYFFHITDILCFNFSFSDYCLCFILFIYALLFLYLLCVGGIRRE